MGGGGGMILKASLSSEQKAPVGITATTASQSVAFFGFGYPPANSVDTFDGNNNLELVEVEYENDVRYNGFGTSITCGNDSYVLIGGGETIPGRNTSRNVTIFKCNDNGVFYNDTLALKRGRMFPGASTSVTYGNESYALFGGAQASSVTTSSMNDVDIFKCNDNGVFHNDTHNLVLSQPRGNLVATSVSCGNASYALFGGGNNGLTYTNDVDIFKCNDRGVFYHKLETLRGSARNHLAATSVSCGDASYALFGGGMTGSTTYTNDVDIFKCNDTGVFYHKLETLRGPGRRFLSATSVTYANESYALFGGGERRGEIYTNDVDIFKCNDNGVFYHKTIKFNGPGRKELVATTVKVNGKDYALFAGGLEMDEEGEPIRYNTIDIYDSETQEFLPL